MAGGGPGMPALGKYNILHAAVIKAGEGLKVSRVEQSGTFMMACLEGEGQVLADGRWQTIRVGQACLLPPFVTNAFKKIEGKPWRFVGFATLNLKRVIHCFRDLASGWIISWLVAGKGDPGFDRRNRECWGAGGDAPLDRVNAWLCDEFCAATPIG
ncbi:hypothetical protein [Rubritalea tangerina]|uniref:hypothetical protein n=1 Tax=Rubritalea tangerina TaxID=430798 RepID=UPI00360B0AD3